MNIEFVQIDSLDDIDFDYLFSESYVRMENTFLWAPGINTYEQRKQFYFNQLQSGIDGTWPLKNDTDTFVMIVTKVDNEVVEFAAGFMDEDRYLSLRWHLTAPGSTGNRNWRYSAEANQARRALVSQLNAAGFKEFTWKGSLHYRMLRMRAQTGNFTLEEVPSEATHPTHDLVTFIIRYP